ncbi:MAG: aminoacyl-tRNA hydrolase [Chloroflexota bacterium]|nr:aminoacyl-tRNA hydrolase [Chloroflexota bacterium]
MYIVVGLGNPGAKYERTRHNVGFLAVDELARRHGLVWRGQQARAQIAKGTINGVPVTLAKPQTFMNLSGESVSGLLHWHKAPATQLIVLYDDMDLPLGSIRVRARGSAGGHNGISSIIQHLRGQEFARVRIGIERPAGPGEQVDWVLGHFSKPDMEEVQAAIRQAADAVEHWLGNGIEKTMNAFNGAAADKEPTPRTPRPPRPTAAPPPEAPLPPAPVQRPRPPLPGLGGQIAALRQRLTGHDTPPEPKSEP